MALEGREVVIVEAARTPIGRGHLEKGYYKDTHPNALLGAAYRAVIERAGIEPGEVENVIAGAWRSSAAGAARCPQRMARGRLPDRDVGDHDRPPVWLGAAGGKPGRVPDRGGVHDVVIGGGVEHMGKLPFAATMKVQQEFGFAFTPELMEKHNIVGQGMGAELIAEEYEIPRHELDELALRSHQLAHRATEEGRFEREMIPMRVNGDTYVTDQGIRPDTSLEALAQLKTVFKEDGVITAGNSSQISDGAAAVLLMSAEKAAELGLTPRAQIMDQTTVGCDPVKMLEGPIPATKKLLERNSMSMDDIDLVEINEAFAPVVAAWRPSPQPGHGSRERQRRRDGARPSARLDRRTADHDAAARDGAHRQGGRARDDVLWRRARYRDADPAGVTWLNHPPAARSRPSPAARSV